MAPASGAAHRGARALTGRHASRHDTSRPDPPLLTAMKSAPCTLPPKEVRMYYGYGGGLLVLLLIVLLIVFLVR